MKKMVWVDRRGKEGKKEKALYKIEERDRDAREKGIVKGEKRKTGTAASSAEGEGKVRKKPGIKCGNGRNVPGKGRREWELFFH